MLCTIVNEVCYYQFLIIFCCFFLCSNKPILLFIGKSFCKPCHSKLLHVLILQSVAIWKYFDILRYDRQLCTRCIVFILGYWSSWLLVILFSPYKYFNSPLPGPHLFGMLMSYYCNNISCALVLTDQKLIVSLTNNCINAFVICWRAKSLCVARGKWRKLRAPYNDVFGELWRPRKNNSRNLF